MSHRIQIGITTWLLIVAPSLPAFAEDYYIATSGSDDHPGSLEQPFKTLARAQAEVRKSGGRGKEPITVHLREGTYYLGDTLIFTAEDSGTADAPVSWKAYQGENAAISGGSALTLNWKPYSGGILQAKTPAGMKIDQLFVNGERQHMARYPNYDPNVLPYNGYAADAFSPERAEKWADPTGGYIHAMHKHHWGGYHYFITGKKSDHTVTYEGGWQNNRQMGMHKEECFVENIFEELDAPGEWFHDVETQTLYYYPPAKPKVAAASRRSENHADDHVDAAAGRRSHFDLQTIEVARLRHLVEFQGSRDSPVGHINLSGLVFRHTARTFMETKEPLLRSDWTIYRGGAVVFTGAEDCSIVDCEFDQVGGNGVFVNNYNRRIAVRGSHIHGAGASGVCFVGDPNSVRNPLFEYSQKNAYADIDKTSGPKTDNYPADCIVEDSLIHNVSVVEKQAAGVQISMSKGITVRHCSIYDVGRAGINISEGTFGGHLIEFCDVFDTVRETGDHGSFNSWGRDRFWHLKGAPVEELPELALLDTEKTIVRNSRWRCDHGWDVDLDDGSSSYEIYNNVFLRGGLKLREGFHRKVYNNIAINNTLHPHVWYENSGDVVTGNIWMRPYRPAGGMPSKQWGKEVNRNFFTSEEARNKFENHGCDEDSIVGNPMFMDPVNGDFRVKPESKALEIGFKNFPMDQFGVQKPELKAMARTPKIPKLNMSVTQDRTGRRGESEDTDKVVQWLGATVKALAGEEFSAYGANKEDGGVALTAVPAASEAARAGFKKNDLIQSLNGRKVADVSALLKPAVKKGNRPVEVRFLRDQQAVTMNIMNPGEFIQQRKGLGNCASVFATTGRGRVAFIGGSITEMDGYRPRVAKILREMFPDTEFDFINAGISSTGSTTGAFRLPTDVLNRGPVDLLFIEFAVNDNQDALRAHNKMTHAMEGIVRQARRHNPKIDIVFLYTANENHIASFQAGETPREIAEHDGVAAHYGIPSVNLAADVARRMADGEFDWKKFGGTHPAPFGADIYAEDIRLLLKDTCTAGSEPTDHTMPAPMEALNYEHGRFEEVQSAQIESGWTISEPDWGALPGKTRKQFVGIPMLWADQPGATLSLPFKGSAVGMFLVSGPDAGMIEASIDGGAFQTIDLFTRYSKGLHYPWTCMFGSDLAPGNHTLTLRVSKKKNSASRGSAVRIKTFVKN